MYVGIKETHFQFPNQAKYYKGKVRDVYTCGDLLVMVATDRISAFDVVLERPIPYKGQVLNQVAAHFLQATADIVPNWMVATPDPNVTVGRICEAMPIEMVIRGYLAGHAWREYAAGKRILCGVALPEGLKENDQLPEPIITPTTKATEGHDEDISREEILSLGLVEKRHYELMEEYTQALFIKGTEMAAEQGLILVDTKYEFGLLNEKVTLIDEIHTPDSSRYFYLEGYRQRQKAGQKQKQLSKEFVRQWLIENGFQGKEGQKQPDMSDDWIEEISGRYIELFEKVTGLKFNKVPADSVLDRIERNVIDFLASVDKY